jgi:hypothetical protein
VVAVGEIGAQPFAGLGNGIGVGDADAVKAEPAAFLDQPALELFRPL